MAATRKKSSESASVSLFRTATITGSSSSVCTTSGAAVGASACWFTITTTVDGSDIPLLPSEAL